MTVLAVLIETGFDRVRFGRGVPFNIAAVRFPLTLDDVAGVRYADSAPLVQGFASEPSGIGCGPNLAAHP